MSEWKVNSKSLQSSATYTDGIYKVEVSYTEDATTDKLKSINGTIYKDESMTYAGTFNGSADNSGEIAYSFGGIKLADMGKVTTMILDIEQKIKSENE